MEYSGLLETVRKDGRREDRLLVLYKDCLQSFRADADLQSSPKPKMHVDLIDIDEVALGHESFILKAKERELEFFYKSKKDRRRWDAGFHANEILSKKLADAQPPPQDSGQASVKHKKHDEMSTELCRGDLVLESKGQRYFVLTMDTLWYWRNSTQHEAGEDAKGKVTVDEIRDSFQFGESHFEFMVAGKTLKLTAEQPEDHKRWSKAWAKALGLHHAQKSSGGFMGSVKSAFGFGGGRSKSPELLTPPKEEAQAPASPGSSSSTQPPQEEAPQAGAGDQGTKTTRRRLFGNWSLRGSSPREDSTSSTPVSSPRFGDGGAEVAIDRRKLLHSGHLYSHWSSEAPQRRFFTLLKDQLDYFDQEADHAAGKDPKGVISTKDIQGLDIYHDGFMLHAQGRALKLTVQKAEEVEVWVRALKPVMSARARNNISPAATPRLLAPAIGEGAADFMPSPRSPRTPRLIKEGMLLIVQPHTSERTQTRILLYEDRIEMEPVVPPDVRGVDIPHCLLATGMKSFEMTHKGYIIHMLPPSTSMELEVPQIVTMAEWLMAFRETDFLRGKDGERVTWPTLPPSRARSPPPRPRASSPYASQLVSRNGDSGGGVLGAGDRYALALPSERNGGMHKNVNGQAVNGYSPRAAVNGGYFSGAVSADMLRGQASPPNTAKRKAPAFLRYNEDILCQGLLETNVHGFLCRKHFVLTRDKLEYFDSAGSTLGPPNQSFRLDDLLFVEDIGTGLVLKFRGWVLGLHAVREGDSYYWYNALLKAAHKNAALRTARSRRRPGSAPPPQGENAAQQSIDGMDRRGVGGGLQMAISNGRSGGGHERTLRFQDDYSPRTPSCSPRTQGSWTGSRSRSATPATSASRSITPATSASRSRSPTPPGAFTTQLPPPAFRQPASPRGNARERSPTPPRFGWSPPQQLHPQQPQPASVPRDGMRQPARGMEPWGRGLSPRGRSRGRPTPTSASAASFVRRPPLHQDCLSPLPNLW